MPFINSKVWISILRYSDPVSKQLPWTKHMWSLSPSPDFCWTATVGVATIGNVNFSQLWVFQSFSQFQVSCSFFREKITFSEDPKTKALKRIIMASFNFLPQGDGCLFDHLPRNKCLNKVFQTTSQQWDNEVMLNVAMSEMWVLLGCCQTVGWYYATASVGIWTEGSNEEA